MGKGECIIKEAVSTIEYQILKPVISADIWSCTDYIIVLYGILTQIHLSLDRSRQIRQMPIWIGCVSCPLSSKTMNKPTQNKEKRPEYVKYEFTCKKDKTRLVSSTMCLVRWIIACREHETIEIQFRTLNSFSTVMSPLELQCKSLTLKLNHLRTADLVNLEEHSYSRIF